MSPIQEVNAAHDQLHETNEIGNHYRYLHEPIGDIGIWNGQFETDDDGIAPEPEGWEWNYVAGNQIWTHEVVGGAAGCKWAKLTRLAFEPFIANIMNLRFIPVDEHRDYYVSFASIASNVTSQIACGVTCYDCSYVAIADVVLLNLWAPGVGPVWPRRQLRVGPNGDVAFAAGTKYIRVIFWAVPDANNEWVGVDDVQFQQLKATYSPLITYASDHLENTQTEIFDKQAYTLWPGSQISLAFEEEGYFWFNFNGSLWGNAVRSNSWAICIYIDGAATNYIQSASAPGVSYRIPWSLNGRSSASYARGAHTIGVRVYVVNAGDTVTGSNMTASAYYVRKN